MLSRHKCFLAGSVSGVCVDMRARACACVCTSRPLTSQSRSWKRPHKCTPWSGPPVGLRNLTNNWGYAFPSKMSRTPPCVGRYSVFSWGTRIFGSVFSSSTSVASRSLPGSWLSDSTSCVRAILCCFSLFPELHKPKCIYSPDVSILLLN